MKIKKMITYIFMILILLLIIIALFYFFKVGKFENQNDEQKLKEKVQQEIKFLDDYIISIANNLNNIKLENYMIKSEAIIDASNKEGQEQGEKEQSNSDSKSSQNSEEEKNSKTYQMEPADILVTDKNVEWKNIKVEVERFYPTWITISTDLYKSNINNQDIEKFGNILDNLTINVKNEDKEKSLKNISELYGILSNISTSIFEDNVEVSLLKTKEGILNAYAVIDKEEWDNIKVYLEKAEMEYTNVIKNLDEKNEYNVNKTYLMLKKFQEAVDLKDKDILFIKYKNLINEINIL